MKIGFARPGWCICRLYCSQDKLQIWDSSGRVKRRVRMPLRYIWRERLYKAPKGAFLYLLKSERTLLWIVTLYS